MEYIALVVALIYVIDRIQGNLVAVTIATRFSTPNYGIARGDRGSLAC